MATTEATQPIQTQSNPVENPIQSNEPEEIDYYYPNFNGFHVQGVDPKEKSFEGENGQVKYKEVPIQYNYGTDENPIIDQCFIELPEVTCFGGINTETKKYPPKKEGDPPYISEKHQMCLRFDLMDDECAACLLKLDELHKGSCLALAPHKGKVGLYSFNPEHPGELYKHPVYYKMDPVSCERVKGLNPTMWVKLNSWKNNKTLFTDLDGNPIEWSLLRDVEIKLIPLLHVEKIYVGGGKASLQIKMISAVVTDIVPINTRTRQTRTLDRLKKKKGLANNVASQLAQLRMEKQDTLDGGNFQPQNARLPPNPISGSMHRIPSSGESNVQGSQDSLNNYLGAAPAMNSSSPVHTESHTNANTSTNATPDQRSTSTVQLNIQPSSHGQSQEGATQPPQQLQQAVAQNTQQAPVQFHPQTQNSNPVIQIQ
jgi:hypothetical protein